MIGSWVVKLIIAFALLGAAAFEIGSPIVARVQLDDGIHEAADNAAQSFFQTHNKDTAKTTAQDVANSKGFTLLDFSVDEQGQTHVKAEKKAHGVFFDRWSQTKKLYDVTETVTGHYNNS